MGSGCFSRKNLLQAFYQIQIRQHAVVAEDAGLCVRGHEDRADVLNPGRISRHEFLPQGALASLQVEPEDASRQFEKRLAVMIAGFESLVPANQVKLPD